MIRQKTFLIMTSKIFHNACERVFKKHFHQLKTIRKDDSLKSNRPRVNEHFIIVIIYHYSPLQDTGHLTSRHLARSSATRLSSYHHLTR
jgi:hypothetical protein